MMFYVAKQRPDMKWDYTCNGRPTGYCAGYKEFTEKDSFLSEQEREKENIRIALNKNKYHTDGHETQEEACLCYRQYLLDNMLRLVPKRENPSQLNKCRVCGEFCSGYATVGSCSYYTLCEKHCNKEELEKIMGSVGQMWIS